MSFLTIIPVIQSLMPKIQVSALESDMVEFQYNLEFITYWCSTINNIFPTTDFLPTFLVILDYDGFVTL